MYDGVYLGQIVRSGAVLTLRVIRYIKLPSSCSDDGALYKVELIFAIDFGRVTGTSAIHSQPILKSVSAEVGRSSTVIGLAEDLYYTMKCWQ